MTVLPENRSQASSTITIMPDSSSLTMSWVLVILPVGLFGEVTKTAFVRS